MATTYLTRTPASNGNLRTMTFSLWLKRSKLGAKQNLVSTNYVGDSLFIIDFDTTDKLRIVGYSGAGVTLHINKITTRVFRDTSAWYHLVIALDSTNATAEDRCKLFINGERETSFSTNSNPPLNIEFVWNRSTHVNDIGHYAYTGAYHFDGSMSHFHFIDGTAYDATAFGEYDANGVWKIKTSPSVTYGTNGFFILKDGNSVTDQSGNSNNYTVGAGTLTKTEDNPSNVFATLNPLAANSTTLTLSEGNLKATFPSAGAGAIATSTFGVSSGKWYWEILILGNDGATQPKLGIVPVETFTNTPSSIDAGISGYTYGRNGNKSILGSQSSYGATFTNNDIISFALDMDAGTLVAYKNGVSQGTLATSISGTMTPAITAYNGYVESANFGNGYFGTTAVASAGTNASGIGIFEYDVPTGYTALSTKGLNL
jgi:hypothetical protein